MHQLLAQHGCLCRIFYSNTSIAKSCWYVARSMWCDTRLWHIPVFPILQLHSRVITDETRKTYYVWWHTTPSMEWRISVSKPTTALIPLRVCRSTFLWALHTHSNIRIDLTKLTLLNVKCYLIYHLLATILGGWCFVFLFRWLTEQLHHGNMNNPTSTLRC